MKYYSCDDILSPCVPRQGQVRS